MQNWCVDPEGQTAERMILTLAGVCNGASTWDGAGFSKMDTAFGHSLAERAQQGRPWTARQAQGALKLITKYRRQIGGEAFIKNWMTRPVFAMMPLTDEERKKAAGSQRKLASEDKTAVFTFPYDADLVAAIKALRGEHKGKKYWAAWDGSLRRWTVPVNEGSIMPIMKLAREFEFDIEPRFEEYYTKVVAKLENVREAAEESDVVQRLGGEPGVSIQGDVITIMHADPHVLAEFQAALSKLGA